MVDIGAHTMVDIGAHTMVDIRAQDGGYRGTQDRTASFTFRLQRVKTNNKPYYNANKISIYVQLWKPTAETHEENISLLPQTMKQAINTSMH
jgi:hypothetical protein